MLHQGNEFKFSNDQSSNLLNVVQWLLQGIVFSKQLHSRCSWSFASLVSAALFWAWSSENTMTQRIGCAQRLVRHLQGSKDKTGSRQGFMEILGRHTEYLKDQLLFAFGQHMASLTQHWETFGFVIFGVDGSEFSVPRTKENQAAFTTNGKSERQRRTHVKNLNAHQTKKKEHPRILKTTLFHIALGLPWAWRLGGRSDNERGQLLSMLQTLPSKALVVGDAGFTGFSFLKTLLQGGSEVIVRVGSNVKLLKQLGKCRTRDNIVYVWPDWAMKKGQRPLIFRLIVIHGGKQPVYLITSVLDAKRLTDKQIAEIYRMRWEIELYHRHLKQTMGHRKLLCRSPANAKVELEWALLGYTAMMLYAVDEWIIAGQTLSQLSPVKIINTFRCAARDYLHPLDQRQSFNRQLHQATKDQYQRKKTKESRGYPRKQQHKPPKPPIIQHANELQKQVFQALPA